LVTAAMIADMREALEAVLGPVSEPVLLPDELLQSARPHTLR